MWGVELIHLFETNSIEVLQISAEVTYFQSRLFSNFISDITDKLYNQGQPLDKCQ